VAATLAAFAVQVGPAGAATSPPTISSSFTPTLIGVGETSAIGVAITDPNASGSLTGVGYTDTLTGGTVDNPNGLTVSGCGTGVTVTANPGDTSITAAGATVKAGTPCTISVAVTSTTAGTLTSQTSTVASSAGASSAGASASLTVLSPPTVTVTTPAANASYSLGEKVTVSYACAETDAPAALQGCTAQDDLGNTVTTGGLLDTKVPGQHQLTVQAFSASGLVADQTVDYTVLPANTFVLKSLSGTGTKVGFRLKLPGAGKVVVKAFAGKSKVGSETINVAAERTIQVSLPVSAPSGTTAVKLQISYTPTGGVKRTLVKHVSLG
jgi:hypothetical protein